MGHGMGRPALKCQSWNYSETQKWIRCWLFQSICLEKDLLISNMWFNHHTFIHMCTWKRNESKSIINVIIYYETLRELVRNLKMMRSSEYRADLNFCSIKNGSWAQMDMEKQKRKKEHECRTKAGRKIKSPVWNSIRR